MARRFTKISAVVEEGKTARRRLSAVRVNAETVRAATVRRLTKITASVESEKTETRRRVSNLRVMVEWSRSRKGPRIQWV